MTSNVVALRVNRPELSVRANTSRLAETQVERVAVELGFIVTVNIGGECFFELSGVGVLTSRFFETGQAGDLGGQ